MMKRHLAVGWVVLLACLGCAAPFKLTRVTSDPMGGGDAAVSPDGHRIALSSRRSGNWEIWIYEIPTRRWTQVTNDPGDDIEAQWSPDGRELAFTSTRKGNKDIFVLNLGTGALRQLTDSPEDDEYPAWSPDGRTIVYTGGPWRQRDFFLVGADGGQPRKLTRQSGWAGACSFVPDGRSVVCHRYDLGSGDVVRIPLDGGPMVTLTSDPAWDYKPTVAPFHDWLAFSRSDEGPSGIWFQPLEGGGEARPLTSGPADDRWPTWSASGNELVFHRIVEEGAGLHLLDRASGEVRTLVGPGEKPLQSSFAPDGRRVVYCVEAEGRKALRVLEVAGGPSRSLATGVPACFPRWSPVGDRIAFMAFDGSRWEVATIDADGRNYRVWTRPDKSLHGMSGLLDWSPDGTRIVFHSNTEPFASDLFVIDTRDGSIRALTRDAAYDESPSWTPDGHGILFMSTRGGNWTWGLFRLSIDSGQVEPLVKPDYVEKNFPRTGPDGVVVWTSDDDAGSAGLVERSPEGQVRRFANRLPGARWPSYSPDGKSILFTTLERRTEYWLAEGLFAPDSPILAPPHASAPARTMSVLEGSGEAGLRTDAGGKSPVKLDHR